MVTRRCLGVLVVACVATGCGGGIVNRAEKSIRYAYAATTAARDGFVEWDRLHQADLVAGAANRESGEAALAAYRSRRQPVLRAFTAAYTTLAAAAAIVPLVAKGMRPERDLVSLLADAAAAVVEVRTAVDSLKALGGAK